MKSNQHSDSATKKLSMAVLLSAAFIGACEQDQAGQQPSDAASNDQQRIEHPQNNPATDKLANERDGSVLDSSAAAPQGAAQYGTLQLATAEIRSASDSDVKGNVDFKPGPELELMQVDIRLVGLEAGEHAIHIHEIGDCSAPDAASAGDHFNPYNASHGAPGADDHHVGDMGNITADAQGQVETTLSFDFLAFSGPANILDKAVVVHAGSDDLESDPAGAAGKRVGCGVIMADREVLAPED